MDESKENNNPYSYPGSEPICNPCSNVNKIVNNSSNNEDNNGPGPLEYVDKQIYETQLKTITELQMKNESLELINKSKSKTIQSQADLIETLNSPARLLGTVLELGEKTAKIYVESINSVYEVNYPKFIGLKVGSNIVCRKDNFAIFGLSEFKNSFGEVVYVKDVIDGQVLVQKGNNEYLTYSAIDDAKKGDRVQLDPSGKIVLKNLGSIDDSFLLQEISSTPWSLFGGLEDIISIIKDDIEAPFFNKELYKKYNLSPPNGILLYGPPGCGKTMIGKGIAYNLSANGKNSRFIHINGPSIFNMWFGNSEANVRMIYENARQISRTDSDLPVVIYIDEADAVLHNREMNSSSACYAPIVNQFLSEMDGMRESDNIITVLSTNLEHLIDPAILRDGRIDRKINIPRPNKKGVSEIFSVYLNSSTLEEKFLNDHGIGGISDNLSELIFDDSNVLYNVTEISGKVFGKFRYRNIISGAMIKGIVSRASQYAVKRELQGKGAGIDSSDLKSAIYDNLKENTEIYQTLVRDDWEDVFPGKGKEYFSLFRSNVIKLSPFKKNH